MRELSSRNASGLAWRTKHVLLVVTNPANEGKAVANAPDEFFISGPQRAHLRLRDGEVHRIVDGGKVVIDSQR